MSPERPLTRTACWIAGAAVVAITLLFYALRGVDWRELGRTLSAAKPLFIFAVCGLSTVTLALRALRWRLLLESRRPVPYPSVFWATAAGYFGNNFLPARTGELVRTFLVTSGSTLDTSYVLATALSERVADAIALVAVAALMLSRFHDQAAWLSGAARMCVVVATAGAIVIVVLPLSGRLPYRVLDWTPLPRRAKAFLAPVLDNAIGGLRAFHDLRRLTAFVVLTGAIWTIDAYATMTAARALGLQMPLPLCFLVLSAMGLASAVPSTPGYIGVYQFVAVVLLTPFGYRRSDAIAFVIVLQATSYTVNALWGSIGVTRYRRAARETANA